MDATVYTHHFPQRRDASPEEWARIVADLRRLLEQLPERSLSAGGYYRGSPLILSRWRDVPAEPPLVSGELVEFDGTSGEGDPEDLGHEAVVVTRRAKAPAWCEVRRLDGRVERLDLANSNFVKTARKPYDLAVCGLLLLMHRHAPEAWDIGSDGTPEDWRPALEWVRSVLGEGFELTPRVARRLEP